jgi:hypothetical protein
MIKTAHLIERVAMEDFKTTPIHKTNVLPLRWFANWCNHLSARPLWNAIEHEDFARDNNLPLSKAGYRWWKVYNFIEIPYRKWGTTHLVEWDE